MNDTIVKSETIARLKQLSKEIEELEDLVSFGMSDSDTILKLALSKNELRYLIIKI